MIAIERIQEQLRASARQSYEPVAVPPFTCYINSDTPSPYANYAIPDVPVGGELAAPLAQLRAVFAERGRLPRFEFVEEFAPELATALREAGFVEESRNLLMVCTPQSWREVPQVPGLQVEALPPDGPIADYQLAMAVGARSFGSSDAPLPSEEEAYRQRGRYRGVRLLAGRVDGSIVGIASLLQPHQGLTELAGVGTLPAFRRRGIATALTALAARIGFDEGLEAVFLTAADEAAGRVYERAGFVACGAGLAYVEELGVRG